MKKRSVSVASRFCGPPNSGNGGYVSGILGGFIDGVSEVTLRKPPPLERAMEIRKEADKVLLYDGDGQIPGDSSQQHGESIEKRVGYSRFLEHDAHEDEKRDSQQEGVSNDALPDPDRQEIEEVYAESRETDEQSKRSNAESDRISK